MNNDLMAARREALAGQSPRQRGRDKDQRALQWVYRWDWSSPAIIDSVASPGRRGVARRLIRQGLLREQDTEAGGAKGSPASVVALTRDGRAVVESELPEPKVRDYRGLRAVKWAQLRHDSLIQRAIAEALREGATMDYETPPEIAEQSREGQKQPDAVQHLEAGDKLALELELTAKHGWRLDRFVTDVVRLVDNRRDGHYELVAILSTSQAILDRYRRRFSAGAAMPIWERDQRSRPHQVDTKKVPPWVMPRLYFKEIKL